MCMLEVIGELTRGEVHAASGEIGLALGAKDEEAAKFAEHPTPFHLCTKSTFARTTKIG